LSGERTNPQLTAESSEFICQEFPHESLRGPHGRKVYSFEEAGQEGRGRPRLSYRQQLSRYAVKGFR
jgi:hypothetical protein